MYYSHYKENIEKAIFNKKKANKIIIGTFILFILLYLLLQLFSNIWTYNIVSLGFISIILIFSLKMKLNNKLFEYLGTRVFWIYILQRIFNEPI